MYVYKKERRREADVLSLFPGRLTLTTRLSDYYFAPGSIGPAKRLKVILSSERLLGPTTLLSLILSSVPRSLSFFPFLFVLFLSYIHVTHISVSLLDRALSSRPRRAHDRVSSSCVDSSSHLTSLPRTTQRPNVCVYIQLSRLGETQPWW